MHDESTEGKTKEAWRERAAALLGGAIVIALAMAIM